MSEIDPITRTDVATFTREAAGHVQHVELDRRGIDEQVSEAVGLDISSVQRVSQFGSVALGSRRKFFQGQLD